MKIGRGNRSTRYSVLAFNQLRQMFAASIYIADPQEELPLSIYKELLEITRAVNNQ
jgi:hypothetical protein